VTHDRDPRPIELVLVDYPSQLNAVDPTRGRALGSYVDVGTRIMRLLPGAVFDAHGHGTYERTDYRVSFTVATDTPTAVHVQIDGPEGLRAIGRIAAGTGWRVIDPRALTFIDTEASLAARRVVPFAINLTAWESPSPARARRRIWMVVAAVVVATAGAAEMWVAWSRARAPRTNVDDRTADQSYEWFARRAERRQALTKSIAPELREYPAVQDLYDFQIAADEYMRGAGQGRVAAPLHLSDALFWSRRDTPPFLPRYFANPIRNGYAFSYSGDQCKTLNASGEHWDECAAYVYSATPAEGEGAAGLTFALHSTDQRVHVRTDGRLPSRDDPTIDQLLAPTAADLVRGTRRARSPEPEGFSRGFWASLTGDLLRLVAPAAASPTEIAFAERSALLDLRDVAAAEQAFVMMAGTFPRYAPVEALADPQTFAALNMSPLLRAVFAQQERHGYTFEFIGEGKTLLEGALQPLGAVYTSFVYVAHPQASTAGARTFALFPDGRIFWTNAHRPPTRDDSEIADAHPEVTTEK
jgi:hypothetical protein